MRKQPANSHQPSFYACLAMGSRKLLEAGNPDIRACHKPRSPSNARDQSAMRLYLLQRLCQIGVKNKKAEASIDCKLLRRNDFFGVFHGRNTAGAGDASGLA
jgi:hypothetical protein